MAKSFKFFGTWRAHVAIDGKTPQLHIHGTVKSNEKNPRFKLKKVVPQGFNPSILLLGLENKELIEPKGKFEISFKQAFTIESENRYTGIQLLDIGSFKVSPNIGTWKASVAKNIKTPILHVEGTFPTMGEEPVYKLIESPNQGIVHEQLILILIFGAFANQEGVVNVTCVFNSDILKRQEEYTSVMVLDEQGRKIASFKVDFI